jgi:nucleotide-binding universal stress UspA family protein
MIKKILVPTDGSEPARRAIDYACDLALKYGATIWLLHVVSPPPALFHEGAFAIPDLQKALEDDGKEIIKEAERATRQCGVKDVQSVVVQGNPASGIIKFAETEGIDAIVMGRRGLSGIKEFVLGSVSHRVFHLAHCTVMVVR